MADSSEEKISHKTDAVMRLITGGNTATNPIIDNEFKQNVINNMAENEVPEVCISSELVSELLPLALKRFNCCRCDRCFAEAMADSLDAVPYVSCKIAGLNDRKKAADMKNKYRRSVLNEIVRVVIGRRTLPRHTK